MDKEDKAMILAMHQETVATLAALQAAINALISTHPNKSTLLAAFDARMERHISRGLGSPVSDAMIDAVQEKALRVRQEIESSAPSGPRTP